MSKKELKMEGEMDVPNAVKYLETIIEGIKTGSVVLERGTEIVSLHPADALKLEVEAVQKKDKEKLTIEISWKRHDFASAKTPKLQISVGNVQETV